MTIAIAVITLCPNLAKKKPSTTLYNPCTVIEMTAGPDIEITSFLIGHSAIFSCINPPKIIKGKP